ncbi:glycosyltransferase family 4 protein [Sphingomonas qilianensis]|uniref:Glycosyltransferase family 4 protein n=1 Tax=Sphingomonas qilianensis TaxID=1736690 RepID=A0ABU9XSB1_9SPHN
MPAVPALPARPLHIRHVVRQYHPAIGGLEESVALLAQTLNQTPGVTSSVVTLDRQFGDRATPLPAHGEQDGVAITRLPFRGSTRYPLAPRVLGALEGADIVHVHGIDFFFDFLAATRPIHRHALVASTHGGFFHTQFASRAKKVWFNTVTRSSARAYHRLFGSSEQDAATFARIAPGRTMAIENGVDIDKWADAASPVAVPVMIFIGRFSVNKDVPALIRVVAALGAPWRLIIAGQDSDLTAADLARAAAEHHVSDRVTIVSAPDKQAIRALIGQASFIVSASRYEGFGLSAVEGLSAGLTPVLNRIPPFERLVSHTGQGYTAPFADAPATAAVLRMALADLNADRAGHRQRNIAASRAYGWGGVTERFLAEYRMITGSGA